MTYGLTATTYGRGGGGRHHDSALLHNVLAAAGLTAPHTGQPWSEPMLAGLAGGIGFMYAVFEYEGHLPVVTVVARHHPEPFIAAAVRRVRARANTASTGSAKKALASLHAAVDSGHTPICTVAGSRLPWHPERSELSSQDPHEIAVIALPGRRATVDDGGLHELPAEDLLAAWSGYRKGKHALLTVLGPGDPPDLPAAVADAVATTCAHLTGPVLGTSFDVNFGFSGARRLAVQLAAEGKSGWAVRFADPAAMAAARSRLAACLTSEYGAPGALRPLYADFLAEAGEAVGQPSYVEAAGLFRESGALWAAVAEGAEADPLPSLAERVNAAVDLEERATAILS
ncbi:MAG: hypothetical protein QOJ50_3712 [Cryptosporangiaceae bacterium]|nr:hypothetical protein [Cryptosporangiaceae bacterium]